MLDAFLEDFAKQVIILRCFSGIAAPAGAGAGAVNHIDAERR